MIPMVDRSQTIQNYLKQAEEEPQQPIKFRNYYKAARLQCKSGLIDDAKNTFALAQGVMPDGIDSKLKIAKIAIMINPQTIPKELEDAENRAQFACSWAVKQYAGLMSCGQVFAPSLATIAKRYFQLNLPDQGKHYLQEAIKWSNYGGKLFEMTQNDLKIAKVCIKSNQPDLCLDVVKKMEGYIPLYEVDEVQASFMLTLAELILPIDKEYGKTLLSQAETWTDKNNEKAIKELERVTQLYNT